MLGRRPASLPQLALQLQRSSGNRATCRVLSRWWDEAGTWTDGKPPADYVSRTRPGKKSPYWVTAARAKELDEPKPVAKEPEKPAYVEPARDTNRPAQGNKKKVWWAPTAQVLYSQDSVSAYFTSGGSIGVAAQQLKKDPSKIEGYATDAPLEVWLFGSRLVSFDNRRLWVMKHAGVAHVPCVWASDPTSYNQQSKLTAPGEQGSAFIQVLGGQEREFKGLTAQKPAMDDPTIYPKKYQYYW